MVYLSGAKKRKNTVEAEKKSQILLTKIPKVTTFFKYYLKHINGFEVFVLSICLSTLLFECMLLQFLNYVNQR